MKGCAFLISILRDWKNNFRMIVFFVSLEKEEGWKREVALKGKRCSLCVRDGRDNGKI